MAEETQEPQTNPNAELRAHADRLQEQVKELQGKLAGGTIRELGLDPEKGMGKAILRTFDGDPSDRGALLTFAKDEYDVEVPNAEAAQEEPVSAEIDAAQAQVEAVDGPPVEPSTPADEIAAADAKLGQPDMQAGDLDASLALKLQRYREQRSA